MSDLGRFGDEWLSLAAPSGAGVAQAFGLSWPIDPEREDFAQQLALVNLGLCMALVYAEPRLKRNPKKAARDADLGRDTIHLAPTWRYADQDEAGVLALILPVGMDCGHCRTLSLSAMDDREFARAICDLVAFPLDGSRPLSRTGHTLAVGPFNTEQDCLFLYAGGQAFIRAHLERIQSITADTPAHLVPRLHPRLPPADDIATLLIEPLALDWCWTSGRCVIPHAARQVVVRDSPNLARLIDFRMRQKPPVPPLPTVLAPRQGAAA